MKKILVTGATGNLGSLTIDHLLNKKHVSAERIVAMVRDKKRAEHLSNKGVELRVGDYNDMDSLKEAFTGIEKLLVVSSPSLDNVERLKQQYNVVMAAKLANVKHTFLVSLADADKRLFGLEDVDMATEHMIRAVDLPFTFMRNGVYLDEIKFDLKNAIGKEELVSSTISNGFNFVLRSDLALANATVLSEEGHENKIYNLVNSELITYPEIASILTEITGTEIGYRESSDKEVIKNLTDSGVSKEGAELLVLSFQKNIAEGAFQSTSDDLNQLIGECSTKKAIASIIEFSD
ncbi:SDR family oxidoreductase [Salicibibacter halophilus]|uniref:SDR family oxidoreductase n=1 Tax=Salicibibacter halophilus TaxID=2502791 RepID=A0A514LFS7_9BACI|nr:SDR family oxidoreductase [Salicibibacter halophilus]QDI90683.1 SDR family oxidoreductase [Salicibibacter halophilus]